HDYRNDSTASWMRSLYALHFSLSVAIPAIQACLRLSRTNRLRSAFHGGQRMDLSGIPAYLARRCSPLMAIPLTKTITQQDTLEFFSNSPRQKKSWAVSGTGSVPSMGYRAISAA
ncbi:MAG: hypothetical protein KZQ66_17630, partial [Candidatus Thiodiazotropha sp. (ex Lucinoma aequizonata)]|nr:hypothetical protein [Candidatus Thiodiazotropha sp. (ex Lucinoma aequizonata)]MCU7903581.1 hypothetical protein [Candidatus Thiodiazotropha sp. (ex Lucinoma aequizonata)]MCU7907317.1 hypothetical protein [Candidatus Thiodiazotropha sp. (ex Lucinoma aequizonata)]